MISHEHKVIFIHIPKCAGSSIEKYFGVKPFDTKIPNYDTLCGWDESLGIHLQHATAKELLENNLISKSTWDSYFKFAFIRNPWDRAVSDYYWLTKELNVSDKFENFIQKRGAFRKFFNNKNEITYRGDHLRPQIDYVKINDSLAVDFVGRFEDFGSDFKYVKEILGLNAEMLFHANKTKKKFAHYSHFYNRKKKKLIEDLYKDDIEEFNYDFVDHRYNYDHIMYCKYKIFNKLNKIFKIK